ncbi:nematocyst expressed protein 4-like isoform X2 [Biomphalaria glabrata]|uniref:Nematocyst expressed protein 4-like isoform X2 n=1 Tax=Biomphalaria glabrata TaxID=6526 RepID=A0A9W3ATU1_BIOGL|nr:nematocyst expressed protein 4-like isoform X2 [Biomphalaria glabrata]
MTDFPQPPPYEKIQRHPHTQPSAPPRPPSTKAPRRPPSTNAPRFPPHNPPYPQAPYPYIVPYQDGYHPYPAYYPQPMYMLQPPTSQQQQSQQERTNQSPAPLYHHLVLPTLDHHLDLCVYL